MANTFNSSSKLSYRTPRYLRLKQLNTDIYTFMECSRTILPEAMKQKLQEEKQVDDVINPGEDVGKNEMIKVLDVVHENSRDEGKEDLTPCETPTDLTFNESLSKSPNNKLKQYASHGSSMSI